jgi:hypothetical protein
MKTKEQIAHLAEDKDVAFAVTLQKYYSGRWLNLRSALDTVCNISGVRGGSANAEAYADHIKDLSSAYEQLLRDIWGLVWQDLIKIWNILKETEYAKQLVALALREETAT